MVDGVRAALYRRDMPFKNSLNVRDLSQIRDYLQFITLSLEFETIRVKHVKELFSNYNGFFHKGRDEFLLSRQTSDDMGDRAFALWNIMKSIHSLTFQQVCDQLCDSRARIQVSIMIKDLNVADRTVSTKILNEVKYAVDNVKDLKHNEEIPEFEKKGVLLVDCNNSVYIDRPVVIYLGMEQDWKKTIVGKKYIDVEDETDKEVMRLCALIQQGSVRYYLVNSTKGGKTARPSPLFDLLLKRPVDSFDKLCENKIRGRWHVSSVQTLPDDPDRTGTDTEFDSNFSKSSFNAYFSCPRQFLYKTLLTTPEEKDLAFGNLIHAFAEFYVCYPDDVNSLGMDHFIDMASDRYSGLSSPMMRALDKDKMRLAMMTVKEYIDSLGLQNVPLDVKLSTKKHPNALMVQMGKEYTSSVCERPASSEKYHIYGELDLFWNGVISDYKTGIPRDAQTIAKKMSLEATAQFPEFQPVIYLALVREMGLDNGVFEQFYAMDNDISNISGETTVSDNVRKVRLSDRPLKDLITDNPEYERYLNGKFSKDFAGHADIMIACVSSIGSDEPSEWKGDYGLITQILQRLDLKDTKTNRDNASKALKKMSDCFMNDMLVTDCSVDIPKSTYDAIMSRIIEEHDRMRSQSRSEFPADPKIECKKCSYYQVCTKERIDREVAGDE